MLTVTQELLLKRIHVYPGEADRMRQNFESHYRRAIQHGVFDQECKMAQRLHELVHAAISAAEDGSLFR
jgi:hypothetical protein